MGDSGIWSTVVLGIQIAGLLIVFLGAVQLYRTSIENAERRRDLGLDGLPPATRNDLTRELREPEGEPLEGRQLLALQMQARSLLAQRYPD